MEIKIVNKSGFPNPEYAKPGDAGMDLRAFLRNEEGLQVRGGFIEEDEDKIMVPPGVRVIIPTNLFIELPEGIEAQVRPRSGASFKKGFSVANSPGTIDSEYRGNIGVIVANNSLYNIYIEHGERIAQMVFSKFEKGEFVNVEQLNKTSRGDDGFGSTGKK